MNSLIPCKLKIVYVVVSVAVGGFAFAPQTRAACDSPDPGCPIGNLAEGHLALASLSGGVYNTGIGIYSLLSLTDGSLCTGVGAGALFSNNADNNTATGAGALFSNTTGFANTAVGTFALFSNIGGGITQGNSNTAVGDRALEANTTGNFNTAVGSGALANNETGNVNVAVGHALADLTSGNSNVAMGGNAGIGITTGSGNVYIGQAVTGVDGETNHTYIRNINNTTVAGAGTDAVTVDLATGLLGHLASSQRYKEDIKAMDKASEALYRLRPVTFRYKKEVNSAQSLEYGLIAEDVAKVDPNLAVRNGEGEIESVRYMAVNAMLLNEFLKEHRTVQELKNEIAALTATVKEQASQIQKVSAQIELNKPAPQTIANK